MLLNANADEDVKVMAPAQFAKKAKLKPFARIVVGKISAAQMIAGASTHCQFLKKGSIRTVSGTYLKEHNVEEDKQNRAGISGLALCTKILPLKKRLCKETASKRRKPNNYPQLAFFSEKGAK